MSINQFINNGEMYFNAFLRVNAYNETTGTVRTVIDTGKTRWGDVPFDIHDKEVTAMSADGKTIVLEYYEVV